MRKIIYSLFMIFSVIGFVSCSEEEELQVANDNEVENSVASNSKYYTTKPTSVEVYIANRSLRKGLDLSLPTYISVKTHASETNGELSITDSNGDEVDGWYLLPGVSAIPYQISYLFSSGYGTNFTLKLPDTETSEYKFDILLYQPDNNKEYVIKDCVLIRLKGIEKTGENGDSEYLWTIIVRSQDNYSGRVEFT